MQIPPLADIQAELMRRSLARFVKEAWEVIEPATPLIWNWHLDVMCDHIQALVERRLGFQNLLINVPPGAMKSTIESVCLPAWVWAQRPDHPTGGPAWRGLFLSGSEAIALRDSMKCRDILESQWYRETFKPEWTFDKAQNAKGFFKNTCQGFRKCQPAGAKITGERAHFIGLDDPNDAGQDSKADREAINYWWDNGAYNRLADPAHHQRCLIQQRLHEEDLTGHIISTDGPAWDRLVIRQEYEPPSEKHPQRPTGLGWVDPRTEEGELMFPARFPREVLDSELRTKGLAGYAGQHQQNPAPKEGAIFKRGFVGTFNPEQPPKYARIVISLDTAFKEKEENDYSVATVWGEWAAGYDILDRWKERAGYPILKAKVKTLCDAWRGRGLTAVLIEDKASGQSLIQELKKETSLPIVAIKVDRDKVSRAHAVVPIWEAEKVRHPQGATWADDWLEQMYGFPKLAHDDDVDSTTQALNYLNLGGGGMGILEWLRQEAEGIGSAENASQNKGNDWF